MTGIVRAYADPRQLNDILQPNSEWYGTIGSRVYSVYVGSFVVLASPMGRLIGKKAAIAELTAPVSSAEAPGTLVGVFVAPGSRAPSLSVVSRAGEILVVRDSDGHRFGFNMVTHEYVSGTGGR